MDVGTTLCASWEMLLEAFLWLSTTIIGAIHSVVWDSDDVIPKVSTSVLWLMLWRLASFTDGLTWSVPRHGAEVLDNAMRKILKNLWEFWFKTSKGQEHIWDESNNFHLYFRPSVEVLKSSENYDDKNFKSWFELKSQPLCYWRIGFEIKSFTDPQKHWMRLRGHKSGISVKDH